MIPFIGDLIESTVGKVVGKVVDKYLPASMSEKEKSDAALEMQKLMLEEFKAEGGLIQSVNQTMQAESKSEHWMQFTWRPIVGFTFAGTIINNYIFIPYFKRLLGIEPIVIPSEVWLAMMAVLGVAAYTRTRDKKG